MSGWHRFGVAAAVLACGTPLDGPTGYDAASPAVVDRIWAGGAHTCALTDDGAFSCWGHNEEGQLGNNAPVLIDEYAVHVKLAGVVDSALGMEHTCAITNDSALWCWGGNAFAQLGDGTAKARFLPFTVKTGITHVAAGSVHTCATIGEELWCWGHNAEGELGDGTTTDASSPKRIIATGVTDVAVGAEHTCAVIGGAAQCWGDRKALAPVTMIPSGVARVAAGEFHSCALLVSGAVQCWGNNGYGQVGTGDTQSPVSAPVTAIPAGVIAVAAGGSTTCALLSTGALQCWGRDGYLSQTPTPVTVIDENVTQVSVGDHHACAVAGQRAYCWGTCDFDQLGTGDNDDHATPTLVTVLDH